MFDSASVSSACVLTALIALAHPIAALHGCPIEFRITNRSPNLQLLRAFERLVHAASRIKLMIDPLAPEHQELLDIIDHLFVRFSTAPVGPARQGESAEIVKRIVSIALTIIWLLTQRGA